MKKMKIIENVCAVLFNCVMGAVIAAFVGIAPVWGAVVMNVVVLLLGHFMPEDAALAGVMKEIWTGEMVKNLRAGLNGAWLKCIPDSSSAVANDVIHLVDVDVEPEVLINNTTYPIETQELSDGDIAISLDKFQTKATPITDDELYAISYDKMARVLDGHRDSITIAEYKKAAHALCAGSNTAKTPVLKTSGATEEDGRHKMTLADVIAMKRAMDGLHVPTEGRVLVLCQDHVNDLLGAEQSFREQYNINREDGTVGRLYGFDVYEFDNCPSYTVNGSKKALTAAVSTGEYQASFAFYNKRVFKASGSLKMYYSQAENDPQHQQNLINFRHYFVAMPKKADAGVVMMSKYTAPNAGNGND